ncbi:uncharacterized protein V6R79_002868 [Siganus canaliculatus]
MEEDHLHFNVTTESAQLERALLDRHHRTVAEEQLDYSPEQTSPEWVATKDFTVEAGERQIWEYIQTWELRPCWIYSVDFLCLTEEKHYTFYHYRARFSTPNTKEPIQGTASVFFIVGISKVKPQTVPVEVRFIVESNRLVHTPGRTRFREKWLTDVIESKTLVRSLVDL